LGNLADVDEKRTIKQRKKNLKKAKKKRETGENAEKI
jgi:hypothetical protein